MRPALPLSWLPLLSPYSFGLYTLVLGSFSKSIVLFFSLVFFLDLNLDLLIKLKIIKKQLLQKN